MYVVTRGSFYNHCIIIFFNYTLNVYVCFVFSIILLIMFLLVYIRLYRLHKFNNLKNNKYNLKNNKYNLKNNKYNLKNYNPPLHGQLTRWRAFKWGEKYEDWESDGYCYVDEDPYQFYFPKEKRMWYHISMILFCYFYCKNVYYKYFFITQNEKFNNLDLIETSFMYYFQLNKEIYSYYTNRIFLIKSASYCQDIDINVEFSHMKSFLKVCWAFPLYCYVNLSKFFIEYYNILLLLYFNIASSIFYFFFFQKTISFLFYNYILIILLPYNVSIIFIFFLFIIYIYIMYIYLNTFYKINKFYNLSFKNNLKNLFSIQKTLNVCNISKKVIYITKKIKAINKWQLKKFLN